MRLPFLRSKNVEAEAPRAAKRAPAKADGMRGGGDDDVVAAARTRARRRLIGAVVLLAVGVIGFPMLFDTQPRPLPLDTPIETPRREVAIAQPPAQAPRTRPSPVTQLPADAGNEVAAAPPAAVPSAPATAPAAASKPVAESTVAAAKPVAVAPAPAPAPAPPASAPAAAASGRFVVQVGAYTDAAMLREARAKVEKLGLKTYTQVIEGEGGSKRTRVRLGPFATRDEADAAAAKIKRAGLPAAILTL